MATSIKDLRNKVAASSRNLLGVVEDEDMNDADMVSLTQKALVDNGYLKEEDIDKKFGDKTQDALNTFRADAQDDQDTAEFNSIFNEDGPPSTDFQSLFADIQHEGAPEGKEVSAQANVIFESLGRDGTSGFRENQDSVVTEAQIEEENTKSEMARGILMDPTTPSNEKIANSRAVLDTPSVPKSIGEIYADKKFSDDEDNAPRENMAQSFDASYRYEQVRDFTVKLFNTAAQTWDEFKETTLNINTPEGIKLDVQNYVKEFKFSTEEEMSLAFWGPKVSGVEARGIKEALGIVDQSSLEPDFQIKNVSDLVNYLKLVPYEGAPEVDIMSAIGHIMTTGEIPDAEEKNFEERYGKDWEFRFAAGAMFEIGIDAALVMLAARNPTIRSSLGLGPGAAFRTLPAKMKAAVGRSLVFGTTSGAVHSALNIASGQPGDLIPEIAQRTVGWLGGELVAKTLGTAFRTVFPKSLARLEKELAEAGVNVKVFRPLNEGGPAPFSGTTRPSSVVGAALKGSVRGMSAERRRLIASMTDMDVDPRVLRKHIAKITNLPEADVDVIAGVGDVAYDDFLKARIASAGRASEISKEAGKTEQILNTLKSKRQAYRDRPKPTTEKGKTERTKNLRNMTIAVNKMEKSLAENIAESARLEKEGFSFGTELGDKAFLGDAIGFRLRGMETMKQQKIDDVFFSSFSAGEQQFRLPRYNEVRGGRWLARFITRRVGEPENILPEGNILGKGMLDMENRTNALAGTYERSMEFATQGMNKRELSNVYGAIERGSVEERLYDPEELRTIFGMSGKEMDSYYSMRRILDITHILMDQAEVRRLAREGARSWRQLPVRVYDTPGPNIAKSEIDGGMVYVEEIPYQGSVQPFKGVVKRSELEDLQTVIPYIDGYVPIIYKNANWHVSVIDPGSRTIDRIAATGTLSQAKKLAAAEQAKRGKGVAVFYDQWDSLSNSGMVSFPKGAVHLLDTVDAISAKEILASLDKMGIEGQHVKLTLEKISGATLRKKFIGGRADTRLKGPDGKAEAEMLPARDSIAEYLSTAPSRIAGSDWRWNAVEWFKSTYGSKGKNVLDPTLRWDDPNAIKSTLDGFANSRDAKQVQDFLRWAIQGKTNIERDAENWMIGISNTMLNGRNPVIKAGGDLLSRITWLPSAFPGFAKATTAHAFLMFGNLAQLVVQTAYNVPFTSAVYAKHMPAAMSDFMHVLGGLAQEKSGKVLNKNAQHLLGVVRRSGWFTDTRIMDVTSAMAGDVRAGSTFMNIMTAPFRGAEATNRLMAFTAARHHLIEKLGRKELKGLDGSQFKGQIDDEQFTQLVVAQAKITAFNMSRSGTLEAARGPGGVIFQFMSVLPKAVNSIFGVNDLTFAQRFRGAAALTALYGGGAVPLLGTVVSIADWAGWKASDIHPTRREIVSQWGRDHVKQVAEYIADSDLFGELDPEDRKVIENSLKGGLVKGLSQGEIDIVHRIGMVKFVEDVSENLGTLEGIAFWSLATRVMENGGNILELLEAYYDGTLNVPQEGTPETALIGEGTREAGRFISSVGYLSQVLRNSMPEKFDPSFRKSDPLESRNIYTMTKQNTGVPATRSRLLQYVLGMTPGKVAENMNLRDMEHMYQTAYKQFMEKAQQDYVDARMVSEKAANAVVDEVRQELEAYQHLVREKGIEAAGFNSVAGELNRLRRAWNKKRHPTTTSTGEK